MIDPEELAICKRREHRLVMDEGWSPCELCGLWLREKRTIEEREDEPPWHCANFPLRGHRHIYVGKNPCNRLAVEAIGLEQPRIVRMLAQIRLYGGALRVRQLPVKSSDLRIVRDVQLQRLNLAAPRLGDELLAISGLPNRGVDRPPGPRHPQRGGPADAPTRP